MSLTVVNYFNVSHLVSQFAVKKTVGVVPATDVLFLSDQIPTDYDGKYKFIQIPGYQSDVESIKNYVDFMVKGAADVIDTEFMLIVQHDGMATNKHYWTDEFFEYDYIGPLALLNSPAATDGGKYSYANHNIHPDAKGWYNGNGGFSLRSKKLLKAIASDDRIQGNIHMVNTHDVTKRGTIHAEDVSICLVNKKILERDHGIKFAPFDVCMRFGGDDVVTFGDSLGFHGTHQYPYFLSQDECIFVLSNIEHRWLQLKKLKARNYYRLMGALVSSRYNQVIEYLNDTYGPTN